MLFFFVSMYVPKKKSFVLNDTEYRDQQQIKLNSLNSSRVTKALKASKGNCVSEMRMMILFTVGTSLL